MCVPAKKKPNAANPGQPTASGCVLFARVYCHAHVKGSYRFYSDLHIVRKYLRTNMCTPHMAKFYYVALSLSLSLSLALGRSRSISGPFLVSPSTSVLAIIVGRMDRIKIYVACKLFDKIPGVSRPGNTLAESSHMRSQTCWTNTDSVSFARCCCVTPPFENYDCINITMIVFMCVSGSFFPCFCVCVRVCFRVCFAFGYTGLLINRVSCCA